MLGVVIVRIAREFNKTLLPDERQMRLNTEESKHACVGGTKKGDHMGQIIWL